MDFGDPSGSKPSYRRPAIVVQRDEVNASRLSTVVVCALSSNRVLANAPGNVLLPKRVTGLARDSVANASQIATINRVDLEERAGTLSRGWLAKVDDGLRWFLALDG